MDKIVIFVHISRSFFIASEFFWLHFSWTSIECPVQHSMLNPFSEACIWPQTNISSLQRLPLFFFLVLCVISVKTDFQFCLFVCSNFTCSSLSSVHIITVCKTLLTCVLNRGELVSGILLCLLLSLEEKGNLHEKQMGASVLQPKAY